MRRIGHVARLQIQIGSLKRGEGAARVYDPANLRAAPALRLTPAGVVGLLADGREQLDVHHRDHPASKNRSGNAISFNFSSHYGRMRRRFGPHLQAGSAGENLLFETAESFSAAQLAQGLLIVTQDGARATLSPIASAAPCLPFSQYALGPGAAPDAAALKQTLQFLDHGVRGFYCGLQGDPLLVRVGDAVWLPE